MASESEAEIERLRGEISSTLDALEQKVNVPKRVRRGVDELKGRASELREHSPAIFAGVVVGGAAVLGTLGFLAVRAIVRR